MAEGMSRPRAVVLSVIACLTPLLAGVVLGFSSPALEAMASQDPDMPNSLKVFTSETSAGATWFSSIVNLGALIGALLSGPLCNTIGAPHTLRLCILCFGLPSVGIWLMSSPALLITMRVPIGLAVGFQSVASPRVIADLSPPDIRGTLGSVNSAAILTGMWLAQQVGGTVTRMGPASDPKKYCDWRLLSLCIAMVSLASFLAFFSIPNPPKNDKPQGQTQAASQEPRPTWYEHRKLIIGGFVPMCLRNFTGVNTICFFGQDLLADAGVAGADSLGSLVMAAQVISALVAIGVIDCMGRRMWLLLSCLLMGIAAIGIAVGTSIQNGGTLLMGSMMLYVVAFAVGLGPVPRLLFPELGLPRALAVNVASVATSINWAASWFVTGPPLTFMNTHFGPRGAYLVFAAICFLGMVAMYFTVPETRKAKQVEPKVEAMPAAQALVQEKDVEAGTAR